MKKLLILPLIALLVGLNILPSNDKELKSKENINSNNQIVVVDKPKYENNLDLLEPNLGESLLDNDNQEQNDNQNNIEGGVDGEIDDGAESAPLIEDYPTVTTLDLNTLVLNGSNKLDDGVIYYSNTTNILHYIGYDLQETYVDHLIEFDVYFDNIEDPSSWISFAFRASGVGSVFSTIVDQDGYAFVLHPNGAMQVYKEMTPIHDDFHDYRLESETTHSFKIGVVEENGAARLILVIDNVVVFDYYDEVDPILEGGSFFNISSFSGSTGVGMQIKSKKEFICPTYQTYTLSTLGVYPVRSGELTADKYNNLTITSGADTAGFDCALQNYSLEFNLNVDTFPSSLSALHIAFRAQGYARADSGSIGGYSFMFGKTFIYIFKKGVGIIGSAGHTFEDNTTYTVELGMVDLNEEQTMIFINIDGVSLGTFIDGDNPHQYPGQILITNEGGGIFEVTSSNTRLTPIRTRVSSSEEKTTYKTYFNNMFSYEDLSYEDFSTRNLKAIYINGVSIYEWNKNYYGKTPEERAIDITSLGNSLIITVSNKIHMSSDNSEIEFSFESLKIQKEMSDIGFESNTDFTLRQSYFYSK